jgi:hypothetical protein
MQFVAKLAMLGAFACLLLVVAVPRPGGGLTQPPADAPMFLAVEVPAVLLVPRRVGDLPFWVAAPWHCPARAPVPYHEGLVFWTDGPRGRPVYLEVPAALQALAVLASRQVSPRLPDAW